MDTSEIEVIKRIVQIRNKQRLTQEDVADGLGISGATYSRIESGIIKLSYNQLTEIANVFKMSVIDVIMFPETYGSSKPESTKVCIEFEVDKNEFVRLGLKDKVLQVINK
ncbi:MAG: helix-turn-helix domain-containing protein [Prevotellaceae bacterium]|jgi:transcriptional regulator with XRE-family HTH domain|nr:helix-turn-helix domain-containing protein [Prevotellaceae bacterium]